ERVLVQQGRVHFYEGYPIQQVVFPIRVFAALGIRRLILTNAAGGIRPDFQPGDLMLVIDQINWMGTNPLIGPNDPNWGLRFPDMSSVYDPEWIRLAETVGTELGIQLRKGVLAGTSGPSYETAAEIRMLKQIGADAVTMSTIPEAITAVQMGIRVLGISFISNYATGVSTQKLSHTEVEETARSHRNRFKTLVRNTAVRIVRSA
ncbi:MAG TPA: purine-nucleoside phosphorylase, partial [bacterium]